MSLLFKQSVLHLLVKGPCEDATSQFERSCGVMICYPVGWLFAKKVRLNLKTLVCNEIWALPVVVCERISYFMSSLFIFVCVVRQN